MKHEIFEFIDVRARAAQLGCRVPSLFAILPSNFETTDTREDFVLSSKTSTLRKLLPMAQIVETPVEDTSKQHFEEIRKSMDWVGPLLFLGGTALIEDPDLIKKLTELLTNHLVEFYRGCKDKGTVKLDVIIEQTKTKSTKRIHFEGEVQDLEELSKLMRRVMEDE